MRNGLVGSALLTHRRRLSTAGRIPLGHPTYMVWGSNTSLGKTLVSTGIAASFLLSAPPRPRNRKLLYLKPVQTGFPSDSDSRYLFSKLLSLPSASPRPLLASHSVLRASLLAAGRVGSGICELGFREEASRDVDGGGGFAVELRCETLYAWREPVSPHLAAELEGGQVVDSAVTEMLGSRLRNGLEGFDGEALCVVETAGGVALPLLPPVPCSATCTGK